MNFIQIVLSAAAAVLNLITKPDLYIEGLVGQPRNINPLYAQENPIDRDLVALVFEGITRFDENGAIQAGIAESWEIAEDRKTYTFKIRDGVAFHNGEPITSQDVITTLEKSAAFSQALGGTCQGHVVFTRGFYRNR